MYIAILGRQPALGVGELEHLYGPDSVHWFSDQSATVNSTHFSLDTLGGTQKAGRIIIELSHADWRRASMKIVQTYSKEWAAKTGKITLGISAYGFEESSRDIQKTGIILKQKLKNSGISLRLIPNTEAALSSATSHHNKLGSAPNKIELLILRARNGRVIIAESIGTQNITAYALRDQKRPKRDAFVGMLPPKLAQIMINLASPVTLPQTSDNQEPIRNNSKERPRLLDPFCGTGVVLQEAALMGYHVYGTDLADKMVEFSEANLKWLAESHSTTVNVDLHQGDAMETKWQQPIDVVVCESYLGQPFSAPPSPAKLMQVKDNCNHIISAFLKNIGAQIAPGTPLCIAIPAWRNYQGEFTHLPLTRQLDHLGFSQYKFNGVKPEDLLYYREDQIVARELLVLIKS